MQKNILIDKLSILLTLCLLSIIPIVYLTTVSIFSLSWVYTFEEVIAWKTYNTPDFQDALVKYDIPFTEERFHLSQDIAMILWCFTILNILLIAKYKAVIISSAIEVYSFLKLQLVSSANTVLELAVFEKLLLALLLLISIAIRAFHYTYLPVHLDELMTYYFFVEKGFLITNLFYPFPNNHVFYNHCYIVANYLIQDPILAGRLTSIFFYHVLLAILFIGLVRYLKSKPIAYMSVFICMLFFPSSVYASEARGYALLSLLVVCAAFILLLALKSKQSTPFLIYIIICTLAAYTVPVFFVPFLGFSAFGLCVVAFEQKASLFKLFSISTICVGLGVLFCYLPMFLFSGIQAIIANETVEPLRHANFYDYVYPIASAELLSFFATTNTKGWVLFLFFALLGGVIVPKVDTVLKRWFGLTALLLLSIFGYALVFKSFMFQRTVTYATYFIYSSIVAVTLHWITTIAKSKLLRGTIILGICVFAVVHSNSQYEENVFEKSILPSDFYNKIDRYTAEAIEKKDTIFFEVANDNTYLKLYYRYLHEYHGLIKAKNIDTSDILIIQTSLISSLPYSLKDFELVDKTNEYIFFFPEVSYYRRKY